MKNDRHGKAKILTQSEIQLLFSQGFQEERDRALFGFAYFLPAVSGKLAL
jgi:integrase/recombinase XerD